MDAGLRATFFILWDQAHLYTRRFVVKPISPGKEVPLLRKREMLSAGITELLVRWSEGEPDALEQLLPAVESELRRIAAQHMRREAANHTLQTTALVNEAYLRLVDQSRVKWQNRAHFFAIASQIMRRVLLDYARGTKRIKRGGEAIQVDLEAVAIIDPERSRELIALDEALRRLADFDLRKCKIVELRYFGGLSVTEVGEVLGIAPITVMLHWRLAKAWLAREIRGDEIRK